MSDTINIPVKLYDDLVNVVNRLQACSNRSTASNGAADTSQKEGQDKPKPPSLKIRSYNRISKHYKNL